MPRIISPKPHSIAPNTIPEDCSTSTEPEKIFALLVEAVKENSPNSSLEKIKYCFDFIKKAHSKQCRISGEPYVCHPLSVALTLARYKMDEATILSGMLHDVVEDCEGYTIKTIEKEFGTDVSKIVAGVTKITKMHFSSKDEAIAENIRKMILAMTSDLRVILVKLADRLHNLTTLSELPIAKQQRIAHESLEIYAPIANRLGLHRMKLFLEDLSLKHFHPEAYLQINDWVEQYEIKEKNLFEDTIATLKKISSENNIEAIVYGRVKQIYSVYKKIQKNNLALEDLHDIIAFRIIVDKVSDCYAVLGLVHSNWKFIPKRFKDYISLPKSNGYQSLHTTIFSPYGDRMEIQIRTKEMHELAEYGIASHWLYKETADLTVEDSKKYNWLHKIVEEKILEEEDSAVFLQSLRLELFQDEVFVFTPKGALIELPEGASPIDFAYSIHTEIGQHCVGAKINNVLKPLNTVLQHGDIVEILIDPKKSPSRNWLNFAKTARAKTKIRAFLRKEERSEQIMIGKSMVEKVLKKHSIPFSKLEKNHFKILAKHIDMYPITSLDDFFVYVGLGNILPQKILLCFEDPKKLKEEKDIKLIQKSVENKPSLEGIALAGIDNLLVEYASCCNPVLGDAIIGYISRGRGIIVHSVLCKHIHNYETERLISLNWEGHKDIPYRTKLILRLDGIHALCDITTFLTKQNITIHKANFTMLHAPIGEASFTIEVPNVAFLYKAILDIQKIASVKEVYRI